MNSLFELTNEMKALLDFGCEAEDQETFIQTLEPIITAIAEKADGYCSVLSHFESQTAMINAEIERLKARKETIEKNVDKMKKMLMYSLITTGRKEIKTDLHTIRVKKAGGKQAMEITGDVPKEYEKTTITVEPDKDKIRKELETGKKLEFAHLNERSSYLDIK